MSVLITGATGQLGTKIVNKLLIENADIRILTRRPFRAAEIFGDRVAIYEWHPLSEPVPEAAAYGARAIIHLMGEPLGGRATKARLARMKASRIQATEALVSAMGNRPVRFVAASVATSLGRSDDVITEGSRRNAPATPFEADVLAWEAAAQRARSEGASVAIVRLGLLVGDTPFWRSIERLAVAGLIPNLNRSRIPAIDIDDAAELLIGLLRRPDIEGPVIGVAPEAISGRELGSMMRALRRLPIRIPVPRGYVNRRVGPLSTLLYNRARIVPRLLTEAGASFAYPRPHQSLARVFDVVVDDEPVDHHTLKGAPAV